MENAITKDGKACCQYKNIFPAIFFAHRVFFSTLPGFSSIGEGRTSKGIMMQVTPATAGPTTAETPATE
jgi:hypothetical protein